MAVFNKCVFVFEFHRSEIRSSIQLFRRTLTKSVAHVHFASVIVDWESMTGLPSHVRFISVSM